MNDRRLELIIGNLLRIGVLTAASVVFLGGVVYLARSSHGQVDYHHFVVASESSTTVTGIIRSAVRFESEGLIQLGLLLLIATPVARVALAVAGFALERDWLYVGISFVVLIVLVASILRAT